MTKMFKKQDGMTFWSVIFVLAVIGALVLFTLRAYPLYYEKMQVTASMNTVASRPDAVEMSQNELRKAFYSSIQITNITRFNDDNLKDHVFLIKSKSKSEPNYLNVKYTSTNDLFGGLKLLMEFDESVPIRGPNADK